ncbi:MAG: hypothetical protein V1903_01930 [Bacteroidota bacterium]
MIKDRLQNTGNIIAKTISLIFHPLLITLYGLLIVFSAPTLIGYLPYNVKKTLFILILINNVLLPFSFIPYFKIRNIISSWKLDSRKERIIPLLSTSFFYSVTFFITFRYHIPVFIKLFILTAAVLAIAMTIINLWHKISIHSGGSGALVALVVVLSIKMHTPLPWLLAGVIISAGLVLSSRLWLDYHKSVEVWSGFFVGFFIAGVLLLLF